MKTLFHKLHDLGKKAGELKQVVESAPAKAAAIREAITMTAGELQQLRSDVQSNLNGLRAHSEDGILTAMREITQSKVIFHKAGYELAGLDLDLTLNQRLAVQLEKIDDVSQTALRALLAGQNRPAVKSILAGIIKAEETAANVDLIDLSYQGLVVHVGATPAIRMCWRTEMVVQEHAAAAPVPAPAPQPQLPPPAPPEQVSSSPAFGSLFEKRPVFSTLATAAASIATPVTHSAEPVPAPLSQVTGAPSEKPAGTGDSPWSRQSLDRFKKMPGVSKYRG